MSIGTPFAPPGRLASVAVRSAEIAALELVGIGHSLKRFLKKEEGRRPKIGFQAFATHLAPFFEPLIREFQNEGTAEIVFLLHDHPHFPRNEMSRLRAMAIDRFGLPPENVRPARDCRWEQFDLVLHADLYTWFPPRSAANGLLLHGAPNPERCFTKGAFRNTVYDFDFALVFGQYDRALFRRREPVGHKGLRVHAVGCPLLDRLLAPPMSREDYLGALNLDPSRKTVLYAPHWSLPGDFNQSFSGRSEERIRAMTHPERNLILKPHRMSEVSGSVWAGEWEKIAREAGGRNVAVDPDPEDLGALLHSDVLVSDTSSRLFTFMLLDKPGITFAPGFVPEGELELERQRMLEQACARADNLEELTTRIEEALDQPRQASEQRTRIANHLFSNVGCSTAVAMNALKAELDGSAARDPQWTEARSDE